MLLGVLCGVLGFLQYRWTGQIAEAERSALFEDLRSRLDAFTRAFNQEISDACYALTPAPDQFKAMGKEQAYSEQHARWKPAQGVFPSASPWRCLTMGCVKESLC